MFPEFAYLSDIKEKSQKGTKENTHIKKLETEIPLKLKTFMKSKKMYQVLYGGRSSGKTATILRKLLSRASKKEGQTILCTREFQSSIAASTHAELKQIIYSDDNLRKLFEVKRDRIDCINGTTFIFKGLSRDIMQIKSIPNIDICFVEEAETIGRHLWEVLNPTLRKDGCELIIAFNPVEKQSATYQMWIEEKIDEEDILRTEINYHENPYNSELILKKIEHMKTNDYQRYEHIYLGKVLDISEDVIFKGRFKILDMQLEYIDKVWKNGSKSVSMMYGMDFGFSVDPAAMLQFCYLDEDTIYINNEIYQTGLLPNHHISAIKNKFGDHGRNSIWFADCARPDSIAQLRHDGLNVLAAPKLKNSIESGIEYLQSKKIIVHPRCANTIFEFYNYKYKRDKNSGLILPEIIDSHNHAIDALRYGLCRQIAASLGRPLNINKNLASKMGINL